MVPTAKEILNTEALRDVRHDILNLRGQILMNQQNLEADLERVKMDALKSGYRNNYASYENKALQSHFNNMPNIFNGLNKWNPINPMLANSEHHIKVNVQHDVNIPKLDFGLMMDQINSQLRDIRNPAQNQQAMFFNKKGSEYELLGNPETIPTMPKIDKLEFNESIAKDAGIINVQSKYLDTTKYPIISKEEPTRITKKALNTTLPGNSEELYSNSINMKIDDNTMDLNMENTIQSQNFNQPTKNTIDLQNNTDDLPYSSVIGDAKDRESFVMKNYDNSGVKSKQLKKKPTDNFEIPEELNSQHDGDTIEEIISQEDKSSERETKNLDEIVRKN